MTFFKNIWRWFFKERIIIVPRMSEGWIREHYYDSGKQ